MTTKPGKLYANFGHQTWPAVTQEAAAVEWRLRHLQPSTMTSEDLLFAASVLSAYRDLVAMPLRRRQRIVAVLRAHAKKSASERPPDAPPAVAVGLPEGAG